jgi:hypothetical protein
MAKQIQLSNRLIRISRDALKQIDKNFRHAVNRRSMKQIRIVGKNTSQLTRGFFHEEL